MHEQVCVMKAACRVRQAEQRGQQPSYIRRATQLFKLNSLPRILLAT